MSCLAVRADNHLCAERVAELSFPRFERAAGGEFVVVEMRVNEQDFHMRKRRHETTLTNPLPVAFVVPWKRRLCKPHVVYDSREPRAPARPWHHVGHESRRGGLRVVRGRPGSSAPGETVAGEVPGRAAKTVARRGPRRI